MATWLSEHTHHRDNNFNLLRFLAASLVLFSHGYALTSTPEPLVKYGLSWGHLAVDIFL